MSERLTERARKVMMLANDAATRNGHKTIGTDHLMIGMLEEGTGRGVTTLQSLGVDLGKLKQALACSEPSRAKPWIAPILPHSPSAKHAVNVAVIEARNLNQNYCGTEHLLLAIMQDADGVTDRALRDLGITADQVRAAIWAARRERNTAEWTP
jgi:ATP-dependent Clp protease ATP-binding subunit ClpC